MASPQCSIAPSFAINFGFWKMDCDSVTKSEQDVRLFASHKKRKLEGMKVKLRENIFTPGSLFALTMKISPGADHTELSLAPIY
jgi:hypothetical protein